MGFFSSSKTYVSSSIYNLAGDVEKRQNYLRSLVLGGALDDNGASINSTIRDGLAHGPGMKLRSFFRWCETHYGPIGIPSGNLGSAVRVNADVMANEIPVSTGHTIAIQYIHGGAFEYSYWAEQYVFEHHPDRIDTDWISDISEVSDEITITYASGQIERFTPLIDRNATYIYTIYSEVDDVTKAWSIPKIYIYRIGSGKPSLDRFTIQSSNHGEYVPFIPVRLDNKFLSPEFNPSAYELAKRAYKKATNGKFDDLIKKIADNKDLKEIDYAYVMFGVPLNVKEKASREYLFRFFDKCRLSQTRTSNDYTNWSAANADFDTSLQNWEDWVKAQNDPTNPLHGTPAVDRGTQPSGFGNKIHIASSGSLNTNLDMTISWTSISETHGSGLKQAGTKKGDVWITYGVGSDSGGTKPLYGNGTFWGVDFKGEVPIYIHWQVDENHWRTLTIVGLKHKNLIYKNKSVDITAIEALQDLEESGFLIPIHYETLREMSIVTSTQMMTASAYIVFNCYKVVKKKWYQTWWFSVILFVVIVAVTVLTMGAGTGPMMSLAMAITAAAGLSGIVAVIVAAIINTLLAMVVAKILTSVSIAIFGKKWGALIGTILTAAVMFGASAAQSGASFGQAIHSLSNVPSIIQMTSAVGNGISGFIQGETMETVSKTNDVIKQSQIDLARIADLYDKNVGNIGVSLDPMGLTSDRFDPYAYAYSIQPFVAETRDDFLTRTLLTGTDIAEMTMDMISAFVPYSIRLDLPGVAG